MRIFHDQRQVVEIAVLAVAMAKAREDAKHFQMKLQVYGLEIAIKGIDIGVNR